MLKLSRIPVILLTSVSLLTACGGGADDSSSSAETVPAAASDTVVDSGATDQVQTADAAVTIAPGADGAEPSTMIVRASVMMHADKPAEAASEVISAVNSFSGSVSSRQITNDDPDTETKGSAYMTVRIPPKRADEFITKLSDYGTVDQVEQSATDVADQIVDLDVRIKNAQASVDRIRELMTKTNNVDELARLEGELTIRQTALEQLQAQQAALDDQTSMATIEISITASAEFDKSAPAPSDVSVSETAKGGWNVFVEVLNSIVLVIAALWPFLLILIGVLVWFRWRRKRKRAAAELERQRPLDPPQANSWLAANAARNAQAAAAQSPANDGPTAAGAENGSGQGSVDSSKASSDSEGSNQP